MFQRPSSAALELGAPVGPLRVFNIACQRYLMVIYIYIYIYMYVYMYTCTCLQDIIVYLWMSGCSVYAGIM